MRVRQSRGSGPPRCRSRRWSPGRPIGSPGACRHSRSRQASRCGMAPSEARDAPIDLLGEEDLEGALALSAEAGWNQARADWLLMLRLGSGFAVRDGGRVVATALALPYPPMFGWVSMVLVHAPYR